MKTFLALLLLISVAHAEVREITSMAEIVPSLDAGTLIVFDIDNTLVEPVGNLGSDQWYYYLLKAVARDDTALGADAAAAKADEIWGKTLATVKVKPVETLTPALVREQQARGLKVMALTARGTVDAAATIRQLQGIGIDLSLNSVRQEDLAFGQKGLFTRGVFFVGEGSDKGTMLVAFLKKIGLHPAKIVFADDKPRHTSNMDNALTAAGIPSVSFRYGAVDAKVRAFNEVMSEAGDKATAALLFYGRLPK